MVEDRQGIEHKTNRAHCSDIGRQVDAQGQSAVRCSKKAWGLIHSLNIRRKEWLKLEMLERDKERSSHQHRMHQ